MKGYTIWAIVLSGIGVIGIAALLFSSGSVRDTIKDKYRFVGREQVPGDDDRSYVYASSKTPSKTAKEITDKHKPADRRTTESGIFLRYSKDSVAIVPATGGARGSRIIVDDEEGGYRRNYFFVGGFWGTYSGPAESFRGGGPGGGK